MTASSNQKNNSNLNTTQILDLQNDHVIINRNYSNLNLNINSNIINQQMYNSKNNTNNSVKNINNSNNQTNIFSSSSNIRDQFNINKKYFSHFQDMQSWIRSIMKNWFFQQQMDEPLLSNDDWTTPLKLKKFAYIDFKLNQHLRKFTNTPINKQKQKNKEIIYKQSLDQKIQRKLKQPAIQAQWYQKMVQQIVRDHKNKLLNVRDAIRMRGYNKQNKPQIQPLKQIYNKFFQKKHLVLENKNKNNTNINLNLNNTTSYYNTNNNMFID